MTDYESFPVRTEFRDKLIAELGALTLARQGVPDDLKPKVDEVYDNVAEELYQVTEASLNPTQKGNKDE